jgi:cytochrome c biogenesis protein CcmG/thiol:disulfide interchange protein DsbE
MSGTWAKLGGLLLPALMLWMGAARAAAPAEVCRPTALDGSGAISLKAYQGRFLYLDFWASWCPPCRKSFLFMNDLQQELGDRGLEILAISVDERQEQARGFLERVPADFAVAIDSSGHCPEAFEVQGMPSSYLIGPDGSVVFRHTGFKASDATGLQERILRALERAGG